MNTRAIIGSGVAALVCVAQLGAQAPQAPQAQPDPSRSQSTPSSSAGTMTWTGCLQRADQVATGTSGSAGAASSSPSASRGFLLTNARMGSGSRSSTAPGAATSGATSSTPGAAAGGGATSSTPSGAASASSSGSSYRLDGEDAELAKHVGHQVEITGKISPASGSSSTPSTPSTPPSSSTPSTSSSSASSSSGGGQVQVQSVKMIAATCPAQ